MKNDFENDLKNILEVFIEKNFEFTQTEGFVEKIDENDPKKATEAILLQIRKKAEKLNLIVFYLIESLKANSKEICQKMMLGYNNLLKNRLGESIFRKTSQVQSFSAVSEESVQKSKKTYKKIAKKVRRSAYYQNLENLPIFVSALPSSNFHPILFLDIQTKSTEKESA